jgi:hypothetical protein
LTHVTPYGILRDLIIWHERIRHVSIFAVTVERIGRVWKHENADLLEMASLEGKEYDFVVGKVNLWRAPW